MAIEKETKYDEKSCGIVLFREENRQKLFLLLHYPSGHWDFPKGHVEAHDLNEHGTVMRELFEETGVKDLVILKGFREGVSYRYHHDPKNPRNIRIKGGLSNKQVMYFLGKTNSKDVNLSHEHRGYLWLPYEKALKKITFPNTKKLLEKAKKHLL